ncbi:MAG: hypothetical protein M1587_06190 [Thaumarchaeota archaeon]|nr:hypothetical protein [Nitrososphaerota archaeon]
MPQKSTEMESFLAVLAYGRVSALELASVRDSNAIKFDILKANENIALLKCTIDEARSLARRLGGTYKIAHVYASSPGELLQNLYLPDSDRFNWTVSAYNSEVEAIDQLKDEFLHHLKRKSIRKAKYLEPSFSEKSPDSENQIAKEEIKLSELQSRILKPAQGISTGIDLVLSRIDGTTLYGCTEAASDIIGFERRDFGRSYRDPTITLSPRIARVLVNLSATEETRTILDPFCGLGTILQEALVCGFNAVGVDKSASNIDKTRTNLKWLVSEYRLSPKVKWDLLHYDVRKLDATRLPGIDAVCTEPILLPKFGRNPSSSESDSEISKAASVYKQAIDVTKEFVMKSRGRMAIVTPSISDSRGEEHSLSLALMMEGAAAKMYTPGVSGMRFEYPMRIESSKKRIVNRNVYVFGSSQIPAC